MILLVILLETLMYINFYVHLCTFMYIYIRLDVHIYMQIFYVHLCTYMYILAPLCRGYDYCTTSLNKAWTQALCKFKSYSRCVGDSQWSRLEKLLSAFRRFFQKQFIIFIFIKSKVFTLCKNILCFISQFLKHTFHWLLVFFTKQNFCGPDFSLLLNVQNKCKNVT